MKCPKCNVDLPDGSSFCTQCGATIEAAAAPEAQNAQAVQEPQTQAAPPPPQQQFQAPPPPPPQYQVPPPPPQYQVPPPPPPPPVMVNQKSRTVYIILAIFLGALGVHNFYAGRTGAGVVQLLITVLSCGALCEISWIWAFIDICVINTDGHGVPMN